jgi:hypothetical protein
VLDLLERLRDGPSTMVRRSVVNNLNDPGRVRPDLLARRPRGSRARPPTGAA